MSLIQNLLARFDRYQRRHPFIGFPYAVIKKYGDDQAGHQAALLAYYGFLSLFPLLLVLTTMVKLFLRNDGALQHKILNGAINYFPVIGQQLSTNVHTSTKTGLALVVGLLLTVYGARGVADIFRSAVNHVWQVPVVKRKGFPIALLKNLIIIFVGGLGLIAAPVISGYAVSFSHALFFKLIALLLTIVILFGVFIFLARTALSENRPVRDVWVGAAFAAIMLTILQSAGGYLLTHQLQNLQNLYSTFAIVLGLLYWLFLQTQVVLYAIEIDTVRVLGLWPRSIDQKKLTDQDRAAFRLYAQRNRFHLEEEIGVTTKKRLDKGHI